MRELIAATAPSLVPVYVPSDGGWLRAGTAFGIEPPGLLATCGHVIAGHEQHAVDFGGKHLSASVVARDDAHDLALLQVVADVPPLKVSSVSLVEVGDEVLWGGFPFNSWLPSWHKGMVSYVGDLRREGGPLGIQIDGTVNRGNSGGPIVSPMDSSVIAIVTSSLGGLSDALAEDLAKLRHVSNPKASRAAISMSVGDVSVDPTVALVRSIEHLERSMQLGIGFGISAEYLTRLANSISD